LPAIARAAQAWLPVRLREHGGFRELSDWIIETRQKNDRFKKVRGFARGARVGVDLG